MNRIYLDHAATTPVAAEVREAMLPTLGRLFGNPSSVHQFGREAREAVDNARSQVAELIGAEPEEILFTGGGTEADNMALIGGATANADRGKHVITTTIEHHAVLHTCEWMEEHGWDVTVVPVDQYGMVAVDTIRSAVRDDTVLVSVMLGNNEVGTIQPIAAIAEVVHKAGGLIHVDAVQAVGQVAVDVNELGVDFMTLSSHKMYGPKGVGALYVRKGTKLSSLVHGGGHEQGLRAGTESVPGIVGFGAAAKLALEQLDKRQQHLLELRGQLYDGITERIDGIKLNGHPEQRLPNNLNISILDVEGESLLLNLDLEGIAVSSGSACTSGSLEPSHVLKAMGVPRIVAQGSIRISLGKDNTQQEIDHVLDVLPGVVSRLRDMSPLGSRERRR